MTVGEPNDPLHVPVFMAGAAGFVTSRGSPIDVRHSATVISRRTSGTLSRSGLGGVGRFAVARAVLGRYHHQGATASDSGGIVLRSWTEEYMVQL
jgi:hypothetical protein